MAFIDKYKEVNTGSTGEHSGSNGEDKSPKDIKIHPKIQCIFIKKNIVENIYILIYAVGLFLLYK